MYKIGELSKLCQIPVKTLRYYDSEGLLVPDEIDNFTGYRYYSASRLADCYRIIVLKELGFTLEEIKMRMKASSTDDVLSLIDTKHAELKNTIIQTELRLKQLETIKQMIKEGETMMFDVVIRSTDSLYVATHRKIWENKEEAFIEIENIKNKLPKNILGNRAIIINYETEYRENNFDLGACVEIKGGLPNDCEYEAKVIELPSDVAMLICQRQELSEAYRALIKQLEEASCQIIGAYYEIYHDDGTVELKVPVCRLSPHANKHQNDDINLPFEDDAEAVGKWKFLDVVPSEEQFYYDHEKSSQSVWLQDLYFLPNGEQFWAVGGWTKGWLFTSSGYPKRTYKNKYHIKTLNNKKLMFIQMKDFDHEVRGGMPTVWVYEKVSDKAFSKDEIRIRDDTNIPFVIDDSVLGAWKVRDFILSAEVFNPLKQIFPEEGLFFKQVEFINDGTATALYGHKDPYKLFWTKGFLLDKRNEIAEAYEIKFINSVEYLFIEWKSGDYTYGGKKPYWYVFIRV